MRPKRTDAHQREIVKTLRQLGWGVLDLSMVGKGCPDLLCHRAGVIRLLEVKTPKGTLTPAQVKFRQLGWPVVIVRTLDDAQGLG